MPLVTITRKAHDFGDHDALRLRDAMPGIVANILKVDPHEVEVRMREFSRHDINDAPLGIEIETGMGRWWWRFRHRKVLAKAIDEQVRATGYIRDNLLGASRSYVWLKVFGSSFMPIGHPELAR